MKQTELRLSEEDRVAVNSIRSKGLRHSREVNRAHILASLDQGIPEAQILAVLGVGRTALWRTRAAYIEGGLALAVFDEARPGRPAKYDTDAQARIAAIACSAPPEGHQRWTLEQLEQAARKEPNLATVGRETVRRILKKTTSNPGAR